MNQSSFVLVDTSVWVDFFKFGNCASSLTPLIKENIACTNELILTELIPFLQKEKKQDIVEGLLSIRNLPLEVDWELIRYYQLINIQNGINKVGIPDLIILQQALEYKVQLYTLDKHFERMSKVFSLQLL